MRRFVYQKGKNKTLYLVVCDYLLNVYEKTPISDQDLKILKNDKTDLGRYPMSLKKFLRLKNKKGKNGKTHDPYSPYYKENLDDFLLRYSINGNKFSNNFEDFINRIYSNEEINKKKDSLKLLYIPVKYISAKRLKDPEIIIGINVNLYSFSDLMFKQCYNPLPPDEMEYRINCLKDHAQYLRDLRLSEKV